MIYYRKILFGRGPKLTAVHPPFFVNERLRIVSKGNELMQLCDSLESKSIAVFCVNG
jgi:hypothetical protein